MIYPSHIRIAELSDIRPYWAHLRRHARESGDATRNNLVFDPQQNDPWTGLLVDLQKEKQRSWLKLSTESGWERSWILSDQGEVYGEVKLAHKPQYISTLHRATLMMGIEAAWRKKGWGTKMIETAVSWARSQSHLVWIDLSVFEHNFPARKLYGKFGFEEISNVTDAFRIEDQKIADIKMTLKLR